jgi:hypothetical protein
LPSVEFASLAGYNTLPGPGTTYTIPRIKNPAVNDDKTGGTVIISVYDYSAGSKQFKDFAVMEHAFIPVVNSPTTTNVANWLNGLSAA